MSRSSTSDYWLFLVGLSLGSVQKPRPVLLKRYEVWCACCVEFRRVGGEACEREIIAGISQIGDSTGR